MLHHRDQHFLRQSEELRIEAAQDSSWKLGQVHENVFEIAIRSGWRRKLSYLRTDLLAPHVGREQHEVLAEHLLVIPDGDGNLRAKNPVPAGYGSRSHPGQFEVDHFLAKQGHDPADWTDE